MSKDGLGEHRESEPTVRTGSEHGRTVTGYNFMIETRAVASTFPALPPATSVQPPVTNPEKGGLMLLSLIDVPRGQLSLTRVPGQNGTITQCRVCHNTAPLPKTSVTVRKRQLIVQFPPRPRPKRLT